VPASEFQKARDPTPILERAHDLTSVIVQCTAPVTH